ncbi:MAG: SCP2 sterol-binding domain-containing protein [Promethearchaeota archaeon]
MDKPEFLTQEWADALKDALNGNPNYKKSAEKWEGDFVLEFTPDGHKIQDRVRLWLDLWHGECRGARFVPPDEELESAFSLSAKEGTWRDMLSGKLDPNVALISGKFKLTGDMASLMRHTLAAAYILKYLRRLLADW